MQQNQSGYHLLIFHQPFKVQRQLYSATWNNIKLVHWPLMGGLLHLVQGGGDWAGPQPAQSPPRCTKCNSPPVSDQCTNHRSMLYNDPLLCGFNVPVKGLIFSVYYKASLLPYLNAEMSHLHQIRLRRCVCADE